MLPSVPDAPPRSNPALPVLALLGCSVLWGLTWMPLKHFGAYGIEGPLVTLCAHGAVGLLALPFLWRRRQNVWRRRRAMFWLALFGGLTNVTFASAMLRGDVTRVMGLFYLLPAWGVLGGRFLLGERIDRQRCFSLVCALLGAFMILGGPRLLSSPPGWGDLLAVISGLTLALNNVLFRRAWQVPVPTKIAITFVGCLAWAALLMLFGAASIPNAVPGFVWVQLVGFGLIWILTASLGTLWGVNQMEAGRSSMLIIMELVTAVLSASILTSDVPTPAEWAGGVLILLSALLEARRSAPAELPRLEVPDAVPAADASP
jgi:drug/metabolite transporter (DMT)-like permease